MFHFVSEKPMAMVELLPFWLGKKSCQWPTGWDLTFKTTSWSRETLIHSTLTPKSSFKSKIQRLIITFHYCWVLLDILPIEAVEKLNFRAKKLLKKSIQCVKKVWVLYSEDKNLLMCFKTFFSLKYYRIYRLNSIFWFCARKPQNRRKILGKIG